MDDQHAELLPPRARLRVDDDVVHPVPPAEIDSRPRRGSRVRPFLWFLLIIAIVGAAVWYFSRTVEQPKNAGRFPSGAPVPVVAVPVEKGDMPVTLDHLGTVTPLAMVTVKTQISGYLMQVAFKEGQMVHQGEFLAQIDPRPYQVALEQAQAQLAKDQALLKNAQLDLQRYNTLVAQNSIAT